MSKEMTQQAEPKKYEIDWLVSAPEGTNAPSFLSVLASVCRGSTDIASVLNYFLYAAALQVKKDGIDKTTIQSIVVKCSLDDITAGILRVNRGTRKPFCKKTLIKYIAKLQSWGIVQSDGYRRTYEVIFTKVNDLIKNPPEAEKPKPRGKTASKQSTDCKNTISRKNTISQENKDETIALLSEKVVSLQSEIVSLQSEIVSLQSIVVNLQSLQSSEAASREALEDKVDALYKVIYKLDNSNIKREESKRENAPSRRTRKKTSSEKTVQQELPQNPQPMEPDLSHLSEDELQIYNNLFPQHQPLYLTFNENGRHNYGIWKQKYKVDTYVNIGKKTVEIFNGLRKFSLEELREAEALAYELDGDYLRSHGGFQIYNLASYLEKLQSQQDKPAGKLAKSTSAPRQENTLSPEDLNRQVAWTRAGKYEGDPEKNWQQFELMTIGEALKYGWHKGIFPGVTHNKIMIQLRKQQAAQGKQQVSA
jgi:hypothetical protein